MAKLPWEEFQKPESAGPWTQFQGISYTPPRPSTERTWTEAATDIGASFVSGLGAAAQFPGQVAGLIPGLRGVGEALATPGEKLKEFGESLKSQGLKAREALRSEAISKAEKEGVLAEFATAIKETIKDPALLSTFLTEQVPQLIGPAAAAKVTTMVGRGAVEAAAKTAAEKAIAEGLTKEATVKAITQATEKPLETLGRRATAAAIGTGAVMQGADIGEETYKEAFKLAKEQKLSDEEAHNIAIQKARVAAIEAGGISVAAQRLPGAKAIERRLAGVPGEGRIKGAVGEALSEMVEEGGGAFAKNVGLQEIDPTRSLTAGIGTAAGLGAIGGGTMGGILGGHKAPPVAEPAPPPAAQKPTVDESAPEIQKKLARYEELKKGVAEYEAREAELTSREKGTLTGRRNRAEKLRTELEDLLGKSLEEKKDVAGTEPEAVGEGFEILEQPAEGGPAPGATATEPSGVVLAEQPSGEPPGGEKVSQAPVTPPVPVGAATTIPVAEIYNKHTSEKGITASDKVSDEIVQNVSNALEAGNGVNLVIEGKARPIVGISNGMMQDDKGQRWGTLILMRDRNDPEGARLEVTPSTQAAAPAVQAPAPKPVEPAKPATPTPAPAPIPEGYKPYSEWMAERKAAAEAAAPAVEPAKPLTAKERKARELAITAEIKKSEQSIGKYYDQDRQNMRFGDENTQALFEATARGELPADQRPGSNRLRKTLEDNGISSEVYDLPSNFGGFTNEQQQEYLTELAKDINEELQRTITKRNELPPWRKLTRDGRDVLLANMTENTPEERARGMQALKTYLDQVAQAQKTTRTKTKVSPEARIYNLNRPRYIKLEAVALPTWDKLTDAQRSQFEAGLQQAAPKDKFGKPLVDQTTAQQHDPVFKALAEGIKSKEAAQKTGKAAPTSAAYEIAQQEIELARQEKEKQKAAAPAPSGAKPIVDWLPEQQIQNLKNGDLKSVIEHLRTSAQGGGRATPQQVFRAVANKIASLGLSTKVQLVEPGKLPKNRVAEYDPRDDLIRVSLDNATETNLLHELVHAATVKVLNQYLSGDRAALTDEQRDAVEQILDIMNLAKGSLRRNFEAAFKDAYEFVSYAMTDVKFQRELAALDTTNLENTVLPSENSSLWSELVAAFSKIFDITVQKFKGVFRGKEVTGVGETNALLELVAAFEQIATAPSGGIEMKPLPAGETKPAGAIPQLTDEEFRKETQKQLTPKERGTKSFFKNLMTSEGYEWLVKKFQNERQATKRKFEGAEKFGIVKSFDDDINDVWGQLTRSTGMAADIYAREMKPLSDRVHETVEAYANKLGIPVNEALANIHAFLEALHEPERRHIKYLLNVPLDDQKQYTITDFGNEKRSAAGWREWILEQVSRPDLAPTKEARKAKAKTLRKLLEQIVKNKQFHTTIVKKTDSKGRVTEQPVSPDQYDENSVHYNVIGERSADEVARMRKVFYEQGPREEIDAIIDAVQKVQDETQELNKEANYWSVPVQNVVDLYGYKNYVPFKGKPGRTLLDDNLDIGGRRIGGELQEGQDTAEGRKSEADNPLLQTLAEGASASMRAARKELTLAIKNAVKDKIIDGTVLKDKINFADRYLRGEKLKEFGGPNRIFHYLNDGTIEIIEIKDKAQLEAIRRAYRESSPVIDKINSITSGIGQMHTRFNPAFAPMNFVRDSLTNAFMLGAEFGPAKAGRFLTQLAKDVTDGGLYRAMNFSRLYAAGKFPQINTLAGGTKDYDSLTPKQKYYRDLKEYVELGGKVSYLQGVAARGALDNLMKEIGRSQVLKTGEQITKFFDIYNESFELAARASAYRLLKNEFSADGAPKQDAQRRAVVYTKNLANFEQVGEWGKTAGALFMFFRPAATGAVRAIDALRPAFGFNENDFVAAAAQEGRTPEQIDRALKTMRKERDSARHMAAGLAGMGFSMYMLAMMMSGDDEEGRNRIATDDMARWTHYARFFVPGFENPVQIPWGFGLGAFAAAGAQLASLASNKVKTADVLSNIATIGLDSFIPLPFSRISPIDNFPAFAIDSLMPSMARPFVEYMMNIDGLGREIYNNRQTKYGDAYTGGDNIPEMYKWAARTLLNATDGAVNVSPNSLYFFASNFLDGWAKLASTGYNASLTLSGQKDFDPKNDALFISSFVGTKSNIDAREFSKAEDYIKGIDQRLRSLKNTDPAKYAEFVENNVEMAQLVKMYNTRVNGSLRKLREEANRVRASDATPRERKAELDQIIDIQNRVKRQILDEFEIVTGYKP